MKKRYLALSLVASFVTLLNSKWLWYKSISWCNFSKTWWWNLYTIWFRIYSKYSLK